MENQTPQVPTVDSPQATVVQTEQTLPVQPETTVVQTNSQQPKANGFLVGLLSILLFLSVAIAGFFAYQTQTLVKELQNIKGIDNLAYPNTTLAPTQMPVATADPTATWKMYVDSGNRFSFKYPSEWTYRVGETNSSTGIVDFDTGIASGKPEPYSKYIFNVSLETQTNFDQWSKYETTTKLENIILGGITFERYIVADIDYHLDYILKQNNKIFRFYVFPYRKETPPEDIIIKVNQILSTFKFTN